MTAKHITYYTDDVFSVLGDQHHAMFIRAQDAAVCVPLTDTGMVIFIVESSPINGEEVLMLPVGPVDQDLLPQEAADQVLHDKIGYHPGQLECLGQVRPWAKYLDMQVHIYLAKQLLPSRHLLNNASEVMTQFVTLSDFERLITEGRLQDATFIAALYLAHHFITKGNGEA